MPKRTDHTGKDWAVTIMTELHKNQKRGDKLGPLQFKASVEMVKLIDRAATLRGVRRTTYVLRMLAVATARDLNMPVREILATLPAPKPAGSITRDLLHLNDDGEGIEQWCHCPDCSHAHPM